jgi:hypothetical protein
MQGLKSGFNAVVRAVNNKYINITNVSNPSVTLEKINQPDGSIKIKATTTATTNQEFTYNIEYTNDGFTISLNKAVNAEVVVDCQDLPVINSAQWICNSQEYITLEVSFSAPQSGILVGSDGGACDIADTCYPVRLYFYNAGEWNIAANGYDVQQISGDMYGGVLHLRVFKSCIEGYSALQSLLAYYPAYDWKLELMNPCNERTSLIL